MYLTGVVDTPSTCSQCGEEVEVQRGALGPSLYEVTSFAHHSQALCDARAENRRLNEFVLLVSGWVRLGCQREGHGAIRKALAALDEKGRES